jgi:glucose-1-phosphate thymidylyltransferase
MKVLIPVAGAGTRLRPHTFTQPKPLMPVAGKPIICFIMDKLVEVGATEFVFVLGYLGDKVRNFIEEKYPHLPVRFVYQEKREGSAHAVWAARDEISNVKNLFIAFGDTIFDADIQALVNSEHSCVGVKKVDNPREYGVAELSENGLVSKLIEKPKIPKSNLALVGLYKITNVPLLLEACKNNIENDLRTVGEFQLTDALQYMVEHGHSFKPVPVTNWFDCGRKEVLLQTNAMLLNQEGALSDSLNLPEYENTILVHPVSIGEGCDIKNSVIGPNVTIGRNVKISHSVIQDSIIGNYAELEVVVLQKSVIGSDAIIKGFNLNLNIGDHTEIDFH